MLKIILHIYKQNVFLRYIRVYTRSDCLYYNNIISRLIFMNLFMRFMQSEHVRRFVRRRIILNGKPRRKKATWRVFSLSLHIYTRTYKPSFLRNCTYQPDLEYIYIRIHNMCVYHDLQERIRASRAAQSGTSLFTGRDVQAGGCSIRNTVNSFR